MLSDDVILKMVSASIKESFDHAAQAFQERPTGDNWKQLEDAMWARQALTSPATMKRALPDLHKVGVGRWPELLRELHSADHIPTA